MSLNWMDVLILSILLLSIVTGLIRGFLKELVGLMVWILAIWIAYRYHALVSTYLQTYIHDSMVRTATAFIILLIAVLLLGSLLNLLIGLLAKHAGLSSTDRILGFAFGLLRGVFLVTFLLVIVETFASPHQQYTQQSLLYPQFKPLVLRLSKFMSVWVDAIPSLDQLEKTAKTDQPKS